MTIIVDSKGEARFFTLMDAMHAKLRELHVTLPAPCNTNRAPIIIANFNRAPLDAA